MLYFIGQKTRFVGPMVKHWPQFDFNFNQYDSQSGRNNSERWVRGEYKSDGHGIHS